MADLKQHGTAAFVAATIAIGAQAIMPAKDRIVENPVHVTVAASRYAWPDLSDAQAADLAARVGYLAGRKIAIFCDGADCRDLQTSIDDAFEDAKIRSERVVPVNPLSYGIAIFHRPGDGEAAQRLADDLKAASGGAIAAGLDQSADLAEGELAIAIGKRPRR